MMVQALSDAGHSVQLAAPTLGDEEPALRSSLRASIVHLPPSEDTEDAVDAMRTWQQMLEMDDAAARQVRRILYNRDLLRTLRDRLGAAPPDFIYERASPYSTTGVMLARELGRPLLLELNAPLAVEQSIYRKTGLEELAARAEAWTVRQASAVLAVSTAVRQHATSLGVDPARVHVVPNAVDPAHFRPGPPDPTLRARWDLGDGPVLGFVGSLRAWHGVRVLAELLARLRPRFSGLRLLVVGDGPLRHELEQAARELGVVDSVVFTGALPHEQVGALIRCFDVGLAPYPALEHSFYFSPLKLFEYMASGVPVVASAQGQVADIIVPNETGLLHAPGDTLSMASAVEQLLVDPERREALGRAGARRIHAHHTWTHNALRIIELAETLMTPERSI
ncbi:MAG: glycosyltransferase family 4 protein [Proteobacteria bacterium]|nr:glycosyltransferase family 4 protein [Pseudomonadota bacterium]